LQKLSWKDTALEMAAGLEDWSAWEAIAGDGLESIPWKPRALAVAEPKAVYGAKTGRRHKSHSGKTT
jgi:hypothetical protein